MAAARDWKIDPITGELDLSTGMIVFVSGLDAIRQDVACRLKLQQGEWFLDPSRGLDFFGQVLVKNPNLGRLRAIFRAAILGAPGVKDITAMQLKLDRSTRSLAVTFTAATDLGALDSSVTLSA